jgi:hypothetical protein
MFLNIEFTWPFKLRGTGISFLMIAITASSLISVDVTVTVMTYRIMVANVYGFLMITTTASSIINSIVNMSVTVVITYRIMVANG